MSLDISALLMTLVVGPTLAANKIGDNASIRFNNFVRG
jgi:hypothetical protein